MLLCQRNRKLSQSCAFLRQERQHYLSHPFYLYQKLERQHSCQTYHCLRRYGIAQAASLCINAFIQYNPSDARNCLGVSDFRPPYPNSSHIEIGSRSSRDVKHYVTNYGNSFIPKHKEIPTNHPGIQAFRNKWVRSRLAK